MCPSVSGGHFNVSLSLRRSFLREALYASLRPTEESCPGVSVRPSGPFLAHFWTPLPHMLFLNVIIISVFKNGPKMDIWPISNRESGQSGIVTNQLHSLMCASSRLPLCGLLSSKLRNSLAKTQHNYDCYTISPSSLFDSRPTHRLPPRPPGQAKCRPVPCKLVRLYLNGFHFGCV